MALDIFPRTPVMMIEPQEEMEAPLTQLVSENRSCIYVKAGAGREKGELVQTIWSDLAGSSFLPEVSSERLDNGQDQRTTPVLTIDNLLAGPHRSFAPDLVKLDIQGFELEALAGAQTLFGRTEVFVLETSLFQFLPRQPITREVILFMADAGYEIYDITEYLRRPYDGALGQVDLAFVKRDGIFRSEAMW